MDTGNPGSLSQWVGWWWSIVMWPWDWLEQWHGDGHSPSLQEDDGEKMGTPWFPSSGFFIFFFIMLNIFSNKIGSRLENPYWEEKYWSSKHRKFSEESECHLCAVKTQRALYNLLSALCLGSQCIIHAHKFGTQLVPLSKTQSSNAC